MSYLLAAFRNQSTAALTLTTDLDDAQVAMDELAALGISIDEVTKELEEQGVNAFSNAFSALLDSVEFRRKSVI